jgi:hypothetical protein
MASTKSRRWWPAALLSLYAFCFFWQYFLLDQTLYAGDTAFVLLPFHHFATSYLNQGLLPLWNPHLFGGTPGVAEAQYQVFYPPNVLFFVTGVARGTGWMLPVHLAFMGLGTYLFARRSLLLCRSAAFLAALAFAFSGCIQSRLAVSVFTEAAAWLPWMLLWYDCARRRGGVALAPPGVALAMQILTGAPQYAFYSLVLLLLYHLFHPRDKSTEEGQKPLNRNAWIALEATLVFGVLLSAVQLVPQWELAFPTAVRAPRLNTPHSFRCLPCIWSRRCCFRSFTAYSPRLRSIISTPVRKRVTSELWRSASLALLLLHHVRAASLSSGFAPCYFR